MKICKRVWDMATPWAQIGIAVITWGFIVGGYFHKYEAYGATLAQQELKISDEDARLVVMEKNYIQIDQKLDDIKNYLIKPRGH